jgi:hypothetical protein
MVPSVANVIKHVTTFHKKLERFSLASLSSLVQCLWIRSGAYPRVEHLSGASFEQAAALPSDIRLSSKGLPRTNALAYYEKL